MKIAVLAAMRGELKPLVKGWERVAVAASGVTLRKRTVAGHEVIAGWGGMGADAVRRCFRAIESQGRVDMVLSTGWAGALVAELKTGECFEISEIIDAQTGERFGVGNSAAQRRLVTTARVADAGEKKRLRESYGADMVDMEAAAIARLAQMRGIPMGCFKAISDGLEADLPDLNPYIGSRGQLKLPSFLAHVSVRPRFWGPLGELGRNSSAGAKNLARRVEQFIASADLTQGVTAAPEEEL